MFNSNKPPVDAQAENRTNLSADSPVSVLQGKQYTSAASAQVFTLVIDGAQESFDLQSMAGQSFIDLADRCSAASGSVHMDLTNLPKFSKHDRLRIIDFTALIEQRTIVVGGAQFDDLLEAVLSLLKPGLTTSALAQIKLAALEVAVLLFSSALSEACQRIQKRLRDVGQKGIKQNELVREARSVHSQIEDLVRETVADSRILVRDVFPDASVPPSLQLPAHWSEADGGLYKPFGKVSGKLSSPVFVVAIIQDQTGKHAVMLYWRSLGSWHTTIVDRIEIADKARCTTLANLGVPVTSNTASLLVQFLEEFITVNEKELPFVETVSRMGFHRVGETTLFVLGRTVITSEAVISNNNSSLVDSVPAHKVMFRGHDDGLDQLADGYHAQGSFDKWRDQIGPCLQFPRLRLMLMISFASAILEITGTPNFTVSVAGRTTTGKTSAMKVCASVWGCPNDSDACLISNWDATSTHRERLRLTQNNLPVFLDETKLAKGSEQEVPKTIYAAATGRSRGRGTLTGIARQESSKNITFMTGEQAATSFAQDGGAFARVLELHGAPFGENSLHTGVLVRESLQVISENYGHAGPMFVQYVLKHQAAWPQWRERYRQLVVQYETRAGSNHIMQRAASYLAAITLTSELVHEALGLPGVWIDPVEPLWDELSQATAAADLPKRALLLAYDHAVSLKDRFQEGSQNGRYNDYGKIHRDIIGRWEPKAQTSLGLPVTNGSPSDLAEVEWIGFLPNELERLLNSHDYQSDAIIRQWNSSGWLVTDNEKGTSRNQKSTTINGHKCRVIAISGAAIAAALS